MRRRSKPSNPPGTRKQQTRDSRGTKKNQLAAGEAGIQNLDFANAGPRSQKTGDREKRVDKRNVQAGPRVLRSPENIYPGGWETRPRQSAFVRSAFMQDTGGGERGASLHGSGVLLSCRRVLEPVDAEQMGCETNH
ncbi:hypothetical protein NDU88_007214 [Pleurodeles waltl]|uniref:Uncharacterized protein n=1 Tax=Pleurodeles waltl TaxID=8319 RepID=A0AAV7NXC0_PLEWA|nr:hypothetical protein NDU88_007214 [Pleurodeles waltl]